MVCGAFIGVSRNKVNDEIFFENQRDSLRANLSFVVLNRRLTIGPQLSPIAGVSGPRLAPRIDHDSNWRAIAFDLVLKAVLFP